jgi:hypothetical protein
MLCRFILDKEERRINPVRKVAGYMGVYEMGDFRDDRSRLTAEY